MSAVDTLLERNHRFAATGRYEGLSLFPRMTTLVIGCVDPRVDPAAVLGLELGDALVLRNLGGRWTPDGLRTMAALRAIAQAEGFAPGGFNLVILHHTDCGITRLSGERDLLSAVFGVGADETEAMAVHDPVASVAVDVAAVKANPMLPASFVVSGLVYDVATGRIDVVVPPSPLRAAEAG